MLGSGWALRDIHHAEDMVVCIWLNGMFTASLGPCLSSTAWKAGSWHDAQQFCAETDASCLQSSSFSGQDSSLSLQAAQLLMISSHDFSSLVVNDWLAPNVNVTPKVNAIETAAMGMYHRLGIKSHSVGPMIESAQFHAE